MRQDDPQRLAGRALQRFQDAHDRLRWLEAAQIQRRRRASGLRKRRNQRRPERGIKDRFFYLLVLAIQEPERGNLRAATFRVVCRRNRAQGVQDLAHAPVLKAKLRNGLMQPRAVLELREQLILLDREMREQRTAKFHDADPEGGPLAGLERLLGRREQQVAAAMCFGHRLHG